MERFPGYSELDLDFLKEAFLQAAGRAKDPSAFIPTGDPLS
jgi:hypothetical protein